MSKKKSTAAERTELLPAVSMAPVSMAPVSMAGPQLLVLHVDKEPRPHLSLWTSALGLEEPLCGESRPICCSVGRRVPKSACQACLIEAGRLHGSFRE